jgi:D-3-phosphoglycerate dehydrogenase
MGWHVLYAAPARTVPDGDLSIEAAELASADASIMGRLCTTEAEVAEAGARADGLLSVGIGLERSTLEQLTSCRAVVSVGHGFNHLDLRAATELGIPVCNTYFCHPDVANHTVMLLLACARNLVLVHQELSAGRWRKDLLVNIPPVYGETIGLIGFGHIGAAVAIRAQALGMEVIATDPFADTDRMLRANVRPVDFDELLDCSDYVSLHLPLSDQTLHMIGEPALRAMRPTAYLLNTARGGLVDEPALVKALTEGWIAGAGLDVFEREPPDPANPLLTLPNVVHTPHAAGTSRASLPNGRRSGAAALAQALRGIWPPHVVNPEVRGATRFPFVDAGAPYAARG